MHHASKPGHAPALLGLLALAISSSALPARADALSDLKAQIDALQQQVNELTRQQQLQQAQPTPPAASPSAAAPAQTVTAGATPGSFKLPGSNTSVTIGGYAKLDAIASSNSAGTNAQGDQFLFPSQIPVGPTAGDAERKQITLHARQSRFFFRTSTPSRWGDVTTLVEGDFFGADGNESVSNSHSLRLRHAYGTIGNLSAGQYWTNFENEGALPETLDFGGPVGEIFVRQAQVRWTQPFANGDWSVSFENPESSFTLPGVNTTFRADDDRYPDLTARLRFNAAGGKYSIQTLVRNIRGDFPGAAASGTVPARAATNDSRWGAAIGISGVVPTVGKDDFRFNLNAGNVLGRYQELGFLPDGHVDATGRISTARAVSGYAAYRHFWTPDLRSSLVLGAVRASNPGGVPDLTNKNSESAHLNLIWSPVTNVNLGAEYIYARREVESGLAGRLQRVQLSAQYGF